MELTKSDINKLIDAYEVLSKVETKWNKIPNSDIILIKGRFILKPELNSTLTLFKKICLPYIGVKNG